MERYCPRIVDDQIQKKLSYMGAVVIEGCKWCGKTTTAKQLTKSQLYLADPDKMNEYKIIGDASPHSLLDGEKPRLIDEWQIAPKLWDAIRSDVDRAESLGQYLLTGSSTPQNKTDIFHSGTGRFSWVRMRPMSLFESGDSTGEISLQRLFAGEEKMIGRNERNSLEEIAYLTCRGGWPQIKQIADKDNTLQIAYEYIDGIVRADSSTANDNNTTNRTERLRQLLKSLARHQGTQASMETILADMGSKSPSVITLKSDLDYLAGLFVTEDAAAWNPNLRSKTAIRTSDTHYFVDPSLGAAALGLGPQDLMNDINTFGLLFETMCLRDLRIYASVLSGEVYHYRDKNGLECDAVIHLRNGRYGLIEIKIGGDALIEEGAESLKSLRDNKLDISKMQSPAFCAVITATGNYAYQREDGVYVLPIACLGP